MVQALLVLLLRSTVWSLIHGEGFKISIIIILFKWCCGVLVGSPLHWVMRQSQILLIWLLHLILETRQSISAATWIFWQEFNMNVVKWGGCLWICNHNQVQVDVWVMKDYWVKESWSQLFSVAQPIRSFEFVVP